MVKKEAVKLKKDGGRDILGIEGRKMKREMLYYNFKFFKNILKNSVFRRFPKP